MPTNKQWDHLKASWDATLTISDLVDEIDESHGEETYESIALRELERGFPLAVRSLVSLALHADDDRVRNKAANDVINHNLALMQARLENNPAADRLINFMKDVFVEQGAEARKQVEASKQPLSESTPQTAKPLPPVGSLLPRQAQADQVLDELQQLHRED